MSWSKYAPLVRVRNQLARLARTINGLVWPPRSLITGELVEGPGLIEPEYWRMLDFVTAPLCIRCGAPFEAYLGEAADADQSCAACIAKPPAYDRARAALAYSDVSRDLILPLKYAGRRDGLALMASWTVNAGKELCDDAELIVPIPLHYTRLARRGFNQAGWLAAAISRQTGVPLSVDALKRVRATPTQAGKSARGRRRNVAGAFSVRRPKRVKDRRILLVDDVFTTGATVEACAKVLRRAGAVSVDVVTVARVVRPADGLI
ncbi:MAG: ComF family protein [Pseudomonadota bacterium]